MAHRDEQVRLEFSVAIGVLRTWMGERPSLSPARMTPTGLQPRQNLAAQQALTCCLPIRYPCHGLGQRMQFGQLKRREFIMRRPTPRLSILVIPAAD
jgi:hypothetical protein